MRTLFAFLAVLLFCPVLLTAQLDAAFSASTTSGCGTAQVSFINSSTLDGSPIGCGTAGYSYTWNLGGVNSTLCSPSRIFSTPGAYTICLTVTAPDGTADTECIAGYINVFPLPQPALAASPQSGCSPLEVTFTDLTTGVAPVVARTWVLGGQNGLIQDDGSAPSVNNTYVNPGNYSVSLLVTDANGCIASVAQSNLVQVSTSPSLAIGADQTAACNAPLNINFTNDAIQAGVVYEWFFEGADNLASFQGDEPPTVTWTQNGAFDVTLIGTNTFTGCSDTLVLDDYVGIGSNVGFTASTESVCTGVPVQFEDFSEGAPTGWTWDFGDNTSSTQQNPAHSYDAAGCYTVTLTVNYGSSCSASFTYPTCIEVTQGPSASFTMDDPNACQLPHTVAFDATGSIFYTYEWAFGLNGALGSSSDEDPSFTFTTGGTFPITMTATDTTGCTVSVSNTVSVQPLQVSFGPNEGFEGCAPVTGSMVGSSNSTTPITAWTWLLDGEVTSGQTLNFSLDAPGEYNVILAVVNADGCTDTLVRPSFIAVGVPPIVDFTVDQDTVCLDSIVQFSNLTTLPGGLVGSVEYGWSVGDDPDLIFTENVVLPLADTGAYTICLSATYNGCPNVLCVDSLVQANGPRARFTHEIDCTDPYTVIIDNNSYAADSLFWDFGVPGGTSNDSLPTFTYSETGTYTITLTAFNSNTGCTGIRTRTVTITDPQAAFSILPEDTVGCTPHVVLPVQASEFAETYTWSAPGGTVVTSGSGATPASPRIRYNNPGEYSDIRLIIEDENGCRDTAVYTGTILVNDVIVDFEADTLTGCSPLPVTFTEAASSVYGQNISWFWRLGNGDTLAGQTVSYVYDTPGLYDVTLIVEDDFGCVDSLVQSDFIQPTFPQVAFEVQPVACTDQGVQFTNLSSGVGLSYVWDFGDGASATLSNPFHSYQNEGVYTVCLTATDINGCDSTFCLTDVIVIENPVAAFVPDTTYASCPPLIVNFSNQSQNAAPDGFTWFFGDGTGTTTDTDPTYVYVVPGIYDVTLIATGLSGCRDTLVLDSLLQIDGPVGTFNFPVDSVCAPSTVQFVSTSLQDADHFMDFGDGVIDSSLVAVTSDTFTYTYQNGGIFIPTLVLVDENGCAQAFVATDTILVAELHADFAAIDTTVCDDEQVSFVNLSSSNIPILDYQWAFEGAVPGASTAIEPTGLAYPDNGFFDVTLIASDGLCTDTLTRTNYIARGPSPQASFNINPPSACEPATIGVSSTSSIAFGSIVDYQYTFVGTGDASNVPSTFYVYPAQGTYDINLAIASNLGCTDEVTNSVSVFETPSVIVSGADTLCIGEVAQLQATILNGAAGATISWFPTTGLSCTDCPNPVASPGLSVTYTVLVTTPNGCTAQASVPVTVLPFQIPDVNLTPDTVVCYNGFVQLFAYGGATPTSYDWDESGPGLSCYNCANPFVETAVPATYSVTVTGLGGCRNSASVTVGVIDPSQPFAGPDRSICLGDTAQLAIQFGSSPVWEENEELTCYFCNTTAASPVADASYPVSVFSPEGCQIFDTVSVFVIRPESVDAGPDAVLCTGGSLQLQGTGIGTYAWSGPNLSNPNSQTPTVSPSSSTSYYLSVTQDACTLTDSVFVTVADRAEVSVSDILICAGDTAQLFAEGLADTYAWSPAEFLDDPSVAAPLVSVQETTVFSLTAGLGNCGSSSTSAVVEVDPLPEASLNPFTLFSPGAPLFLQVDAPLGNSYQYQWLNTSNLSCTTCPNPVLLPDSLGGVYSVLVTDPNTGCSLMLSTELQQVLECFPDLIMLPNAFTPNGDGENDVLYVRGSALTSITSFQVFNRWGELVFQTNSLQQGWDGLYSNSQAPAGVYVYMVQAPCPVNPAETVIKTGNVTLIR